MIFVAETWTACGFPPSNPFWFNRNLGSPKRGFPQILKKSIFTQPIIFKQPIDLSRLQESAHFLESAETELAEVLPDSTRNAQL